jgi:hypothetical protein
MQEESLSVKLSCLENTLVFPQALITPSDGVKIST